jgi:hypothetical protein
MKSLKSGKRPSLDSKPKEVLKAVESDGITDSRDPIS